MAQDSMSPISFFTSDASSPTASNPRPPADSAEAKGNDFVTALSKAHKGPEPVKLDRPKLGNKEPFFPRKPMPYHADDLNSSRGYAVSNETSTQGRPVVRAERLNDADSESDDDQTQETFAHDAAGNGDRQGVLSKSYDGTAVSYPVRQVAAQSLDEKTKDDLQKKGLWNLPSMVMAQPSAKVLAMKAVVEAQRSSSSGSVSSVPVQKPIAQFMASLENELGVTPDRLAQALQNLPAGQLQLPPQQTMIQVIKNLGLKGQDQTKALGLYSKMLAQMQMLGENQAPQASPLLAGGLTGLKLEKQVEVELARELKAAQEENADPKEIGVKQANQSQSNVQEKSEPSALGMLKASQVNSSIDPQDQQLRNSDSKVQTGKGQEGNAFSVKNYLSQQNQNQGQDMAQNQGQQSMGGSQSQLSARHEQAAAKDQVKFDLKHDLSVKGQASTPQNNLVDTRSISVAQPGAVNDSNGTLQPVAVPITGATGHTNDATTKHAAIQSIINNAQMLAHKGGGEMHMTLKPEHLGEIQLRVAMDGNRVNVQLTTERNEVKKLIEQGVHELRHGLAQHNLSMEKLDVSVSDKNTGSFQQRNPDFAAAKDFSNQFQQQNGRREMMESLSELRSNGNSRSQNGSVASAAQAAQSLRNVSEKSSSGRLNVMA